MSNEDLKSLAFVFIGKCGRIESNRLPLKCRHEMEWKEREFVAINASKSEASTLFAAHAFLNIAFLQALRVRLEES